MTRLVTLLLVSMVVFGATQALPGDAARAVLGVRATPERLELLREELQLDRSLLVQYTDWLGGVLRGDFGDSLASRLPVTSVLGDRFFNSLVLLVLSMAIVVPLSFALGAYTAIRRNGLVDRGVLLTSLVIAALPGFVIGIVLILLFATVVWPIVPAVALFPPGDSPLSHPTQLVLPVATLVIMVIPYLYRLIRGSMSDVLETPFVEMARLKGLPERVVIVRHALPNALVPAVQASAIVMAYLLGGIVVIEFLFRYPGLGMTLTDAISTRDLPMVQAVTLVLATGVVVFNLLADMLTVWVSPRARAGGDR